MCSGVSQVSFCTVRIIFLFAFFFYRLSYNFLFHSSIQKTRLFGTILYSRLVKYYKSQHRKISGLNDRCLKPLGYCCFFIRLYFKISVVNLKLVANISKIIARTSSLEMLVKIQSVTFKGMLYLRWKFPQCSMCCIVAP